MTDPTTPQTAKQPTPGAAADPTASASTSSTCDGAKVEFKLTHQERTAIMAIIVDYTLGKMKGQTPKVAEAVDSIEAIINEQWQSCVCELTQLDLPLR